MWPLYSAYFKKQKKWCEINERVTWSNEVMHWEAVKKFGSRLCKQAYLEGKSFYQFLVRRCSSQNSMVQPILICFTIIFYWVNRNLTRKRWLNFYEWRNRCFKTHFFESPDPWAVKIFFACWLLFGYVRDSENWYSICKLDCHVLHVLCSLAPLTRSWWFLKLLLVVCKAELARLIDINRNVMMDK